MLGNLFTLVSIAQGIASVYDGIVQRRRQREADERERRREQATDEKERRIVALEERLAKLERGGAG